MEFEKDAKDGNKTRNGIR